LKQFRCRNRSVAEIRSVNNIYRTMNNQEYDDGNRMFFMRSVQNKSCPTNAEFHRGIM